MARSLLAGTRAIALISVSFVSPSLGGCFSRDRPRWAVAFPSLHSGVKAMTQNQLNRSVARATGESLSTIRSLGFSIADPDEVCHDPERPRCRPRIVNWDQLDAQRGSYLPQRSRCQQQPA